jgi:hypothetical protein
MFSLAAWRWEIHEKKLAANRKQWDCSIYPSRSLYIYQALSVHFLENILKYWNRQKEVSVLHLVSQVHDVILMNVYLDLGTPGGRDFGIGGIWARGGKWEVSLRATWVRGGRILSQHGGFQGSKEGTNGEQNGIGKSKKQGDYSELV